LQDGWCVDEFRFANSENVQEADSMRLPSDVIAAKLRMALADAALCADIENDQPPDRTSRIQLIDELQIASDEYVEKISRIRA
jgi:hypothetical protein